MTKSDKAELLDHIKAGVPIKTLSRQYGYPQREIKALQAEPKFADLGQLPLVQLTN